MNEEQKALLNECLKMLSEYGDKFYALERHASFRVDNATHALALLQNVVDPEQVALNKTSH